VDALGAPHIRSFQTGTPALRSDRQAASLLPRSAVLTRPEPVADRPAIPGDPQYATSQTRRWKSNRTLTRRGKGQQKVPVKHVHVHSGGLKCSRERTGSAQQGRACRVARTATDDLRPPPDGQAGSEIRAVRLGALNEGVPGDTPSRAFAGGTSYKFRKRDRHLGLSVLAKGCGET
jgi:hypothetical protein